MKKLSKTEKIKRLRFIKKGLRDGDIFMCHKHDYNFEGKLFDCIPELHKFRPQTKDFKDVHRKYGKNTAWSWDTKDTRVMKIKAIDKAIKLIQSK